jgi:hypothetical protein
MIRRLGCFAVYGSYFFLCGVGAVVWAAEPAKMAGEGNAVIAEKEGRLSGAFTYQLVVGQFYEWNTDPTAVPGILTELARRTEVRASVEFKAVALDDPQILRNPLLIMTGNRVFRLSKEEIANLRDYLNRGGFLYADDCGGADLSFRRMIKDVFPETEMSPLAPDHPVLRELYSMESVPKVVDLYGGASKAFGVVRGGRLVVLYTYDTDLPCAWERYPNGTYVHVIDKAKRELALQFGVNVVLHALKQRLGRQTAPARPGYEPPALAAAPLPAGATTDHYPMRRQLPSAHVTAIAADRDYVWVGGFSLLPGDDEGLARYEKTTGRWRVFMDAEGILSEEINCLALRGGKVLVGSDTWKWTKGMATFDSDSGHWSTFTTDQGLPHNRVVAILPDDDRLWIACRQGLAVIDSGKSSTGGAALRNSRLIENPPGPFAPAFPDESRKEELMTSDRAPEELPASRGDNEKVTVVQDSVFPDGGAFMIGLMGGEHFVWANHFAGVACFDKRSGRWSDLSKRTPLLPRHAIAMACGGDAAWFLSPADEHVRLVRFDLDKERFSAWEVPAEIDLDKAVSLAADRTELLVGMKDNLGIFTLRTADGSPSQHWTPPAIASDRSLAVGRMVVDEGTVWATLWPYGGLWRRNANTRSWREIPYRAGSPASHILSLLRVGDALYVGTLGVGPWRYDITNGTWSSLNLSLLRDGQPCSYWGDRDLIRWDSVYGLVSDGKRIWIATNHGLIMHDPDRTPSGFEVIGPVGAVMKGLAVAQGLVWAGTDDGRVRAYDPAERAWNEGLTWTAAAPIRALCLWRKSLWAATAKGLYARVIEAGQWTQVTELPGDLDLQGLWPTENGLWIASRDSLYVLRNVGRPAEEIAAGRAWVPVHCVCPYQGQILLTTDRGLIVCSDDGTPRAFYDRTSGLQTPAISALQTGEDSLWMGTLGGGLARLDGAVLAKAEESDARNGVTNRPATHALPPAPEK